MQLKNIFDENLKELQKIKKLDVWKETLYDSHLRLDILDIIYEIFSIFSIKISDNIFIIVCILYVAKRFILEGTIMFPFLLNLNYNKIKNLNKITTHRYI